MEERGRERERERDRETQGGDRETPRETGVGEGEGERQRHRERQTQRQRERNVIRINFSTLLLSGIEVKTLLRGKKRAMRLKCHCERRHYQSCLEEDDLARGK